jgi:hypothetical protein
MGTARSAAKTTVKWGQREYFSMYVMHLLLLSIS